MASVLCLVVGLSFVLAVGAGVTYVWLTHTQAFELIAAQQAQLMAALALTVLLTLANLGLRWLRWTFLLRRFHARVPTRATFQLFFATAPAIVTPFYLGELLRSLVIARRHRGPLSIALWVWLVERCSDVAALLVLWGAVTGQLRYLAPGVLLLLAAPVLLARRSQRMPGADTLHTGQLTSLSVLVVCVGLSLGAWLLPIVSLWCSSQLLALPVSLGLASQVFAAGTLLGGLTGVPGGLGASGSLMIVGLVDAGVSAAAASSAVFVLRFGTQWFAVALGVVVAVLWRKRLLALLRTSGSVQQHFDSLAPAYASDIPPFYRQQMLERKIQAMLPMLPPPETSARGLDLGCGQGWYACELAQRGYEMHGIDLSAGQVAQAERHCQEQGTQVELRTYDGVHLPYPDGHFDFAYSINVLHHVPSPVAQRDLMREVLRVLKRDGRFLLHEMNIENALFRAYVSYVFPLLKSIDEGTELWIRPSRLPPIPGGRWHNVMSYFTFVPEFLPERVLKWLRPLERMLERSPLRKYSAHYMATLTHDQQGQRY